MAEIGGGGDPIYEATPSFTLDLAWTVNNPNPNYSLWVEQYLRFNGDPLPTVDDYTPVASLLTTATAYTVVPVPGTVVAGFYQQRSVTLYYQITLRRNSDNSRVSASASTSYGPVTLGFCDPRLDW